MLASEVIAKLQAEIELHGDVEVRTSDESGTYPVGNKVIDVKYASKDVEYSRGNGFMGMHSWPDCIVLVGDD